MSAHLVSTPFMSAAPPPRPWVGTEGPRFVTRPAHRHWLMGQARALLDLFRPAALNPRGGFFTLADDGTPNPGRPGLAGVERQLHDTCRTVHGFAIAHLLGLPGADRYVDHGMAFLWDRHRDGTHGGYFWGVDDARATEPAKKAYGHAFVLLAAASAKVVGHPDADRLLADVTAVLRDRFWDEAAGATTEDYTADWAPIEDYRGQNSNMHLTEALMAAFEATGDARSLAMAERIATLVIDRHARRAGWRVPEHFDAAWQVDRAYAGDPMFRPAGTTPGHALEWSRLLVQLWGLGGRRHAWMVEAAGNLFRRAVATGWDAGTGGFYYTLGWDDVPAQADRYWWPCAEGIGAAAALGAVDPDPVFEAWYRRIWGFVDDHVIDRRFGGWIPELDPALNRVCRVFSGKPDLYHALQACLLPLVSPEAGLTRGLAGAGAAALLGS